MTATPVAAPVGVLGLIPAALHAGRAERTTVSGRIYWEAFRTTFAVFYGVALAALITALSNSLP